MDIDDNHYKKYIKYKTKYLELKEQLGGGLYIIDLDHFMNSYIEKEKNKYDEIFNSQIPNKIFLIEDFLLNNLLKEILIYDTKTEDLVVEIYKQICNTILNYREYFYLNVDKNSQTEE